MMKIEVLAYNLVVSKQQERRNGRSSQLLNLWDKCSVNVVCKNESHSLDWMSLQHLSPHHSLFHHKSGTCTQGGTLKLESQRLSIILLFTNISLLHFQTLLYSFQIGECRVITINCCKAVKDCKLQEVKGQGALKMHFSNVCYNYVQFSKMPSTNHIL